MASIPPPQLLLLSASFIIISLHRLRSFLFFFCFTWACSVLLGAYVNQLPSHHLSLSLFLLFLQASHIKLAFFFYHLRTMFPPTPNPFLSAPLFLRFFGGFLQLSLSSTTILLSYLRLKHLHLHHTRSACSLQTSLFLFYISIISTAAISLFEVCCSLFLTFYLSKFFPLWQSRVDVIIWEGYNKSLLHAIRLGDTIFHLKNLENLTFADVSVLAKTDLNGSHPPQMNEFLDLEVGKEKLRDVTDKSELALDYDMELGDTSSSACSPLPSDST